MAAPSTQDILIIGAGPAGAIAGIALARRGHAVTIVEQDRFPRDKVCGECLSAVGIGVLRRLDLLNQLKRFDPVQLKRATLVTPDGSTLRIDLPTPMLGISRRVMDAELLQAARDAGASVLQPARVESLVAGVQGSRRDSSAGRPAAGGGAPSVVVRNLESNERSTIESDCVFLADGKAALLGEKPQATGDLGIKAHFLNVHADAEAIALLGVAGHYVGVAPIEGGRWNVAYSVPASRVRSFGGDLSALFAAIVDENQTLKSMFRNASLAGAWLAAPLPRFAVRRVWPAGIIPVGNAAAALEPIGGEGMGLAMRSAELAAAAVSRGVDRSHLLDQYTGLWRTRRLACRATAVLLSRPRVASTLLRVARGAGPFVRAVTRAIGK